MIMRTQDPGDWHEEKGSYKLQKGMTAGRNETRVEGEKQIKQNKRAKPTKKYTRSIISLDSDLGFM